MNKLPDKYILNRCSQCGEMFTKENMIEYESVWVCAGCKPIFLQKIKEGIEIVPKAANMIGWKIFFFISLALTLYSFTLSMRSILNAEKLFESILDLIIYPFAIIALFGFAFEKRIWKRIIWKILFPVTILTDFIEMALSIANETHDAPIIALIIVFIVLSPLFVFEYIALYKYAFSKRKPWL